MKVAGVVLAALVCLMVIAGLGVTVLELRKLNEALEAIKSDGVWVHGALSELSQLTGQSY